METSLEVDDLWTEFVTTRRPELRDELILHYAPLVRLVVGRLGIPSTGLLEASDLISYGMIGLINAVDRYDPARGVRFEAFATARIRGAVIDQLRALNWLPRAAVSRVRQQEDDFPTLGELLEDHSTPGPLEQLEMQEKLSLLTSALDRLPERERLLLAMYYQEELTMKEISKVMGVSESRICQLHMQAIMRLRSIFNVAGQVEHESRDGEEEKVSEVGGEQGSLVHSRWHRRWNTARL